MLFRSYRSMLLDFSEFSRKNQTTSTLGELGEPKFEMDGRAVNEWWARPQNDGPALRAIALIRLAWGLLEEGREAEVWKLYDGKLPTSSVIKADLEYVSHHWKELCFDLWEELKGDHFYTLMVQRRALKEGALLANELGDEGAAAWYEKEADEISERIEDFWNAKKGVMVPTLDRKEGVEYKTADLDSAIILGALHGDTEDGFFSPSDDRLLSTLFHLEASFKDLYAINKQHPSLGVAIGRYPEDQYFGGNPWVLTTLGYAEFYYRLAAEYYTAGEIHLTDLNLDFFKELLKDTHIVLESGRVVTLSEALFYVITVKLRRRGDTFLDRVQAHALSDGSLFEQIDKENGEMLSAADLSWNYAAFLTTVWARDVALKNEE